jgi:hypothetical protein
MIYRVQQEPAGWLFPEQNNSSVLTLPPYSLQDRFYYYLFVYGEIRPSGLLPSGSPTMSLYAFLRNLKHLSQCLDLVGTYIRGGEEEENMKRKKERGKARETISI